MSENEQVDLIESCEKEISECLNLQGIRRSLHDSTVSVHRKKETAFQMGLMSAKESGDPLLAQDQSQYRGRKIPIEGFKNILDSTSSIQVEKVASNSPKKRKDSLYSRQQQVFN